MASARRPVLWARRVTVARKAGKMEQHREAGCTLNQRSNRRAAKAQDEVSFPVPWHRPIGRFGRTLADPDLGRDKPLAAPADARPWHPQHPPCSQAGREFAAQRSSALDEEGLINGFVADAHCLVVREVDRQVPGDLFRAPGPGPSPILSLAMPAALPGHGRTGNGDATRRDDDARQSLLPISAQGRVEGKLRRFRATGRSLGMPLGGRRAISCREWPWTRRSAISSRSTNDRYRPECGFAEDLNIAGGMPPAFRNHLVPTGCDTPASAAASSLLIPAAIANQNRLRSSRPATGGRPGDGNGARPDRSDRRFRMLIANSSFRVLRRPFESKLTAAIRMMNKSSAWSLPL